MVFLYIIKTQNKDLLEDERTCKIGSKAARATIGGFCIRVSDYFNYINGIESK